MRIREDFASSTGGDVSGDYVPEQYYASEAAPYYAPEPTYYYAPEPAPEPAPVASGLDALIAPELMQPPMLMPLPIGMPMPVYSEPEPTYSAASVAQVAEPAPVASGLDALIAQPMAAPMAAPMATPPEAAPFTLTPEMTADIQRRAQLSMAPNAAFGLSSMDPGVLSKADPLFEYAQTAPVLELKGNREHETLKFQPLPNTNYKLVVGGKDLGTGSTPEQVAALVEAANEISEAGGKMVDVRLQKETQYADKAGGVQTAFADIYANQKNNAGALEFIVPAILAAASAGVLAPALAPALGASLGISQAAASTLAAGLAAGAGTTTGKLALGSSLKDALIQGGLSGLTAGVMQGTGLTDALKGALGGASTGGGPQLSDAFNAARGASGALQDVFATSGLGAIGGAAGQTAAQTLAQALPSALDEIVVTGARSALPNLLSGAATSAIGSGLSGVGNSLLTPKLEPLNPQMQTPEAPLAVQASPSSSLAVSPDELAGLTVTGSRIPNILTDVGSALATLPSLAVQPTTPTTTTEQQQVAGDDEMINILANREPLSVINTLPIPFAPPPSLAVQPIPEIQTPPAEQAAADEEMVVTARKEPLSVINTPAIPFAPPPPLAVQPIPEIQTPPAEQVAGDDKQIDVTGSKLTDKGSIFPVPVPSILGPALSGADTTPPADKKLTVSDYLKLAGLAVSGVGALVDGGSGGKGTAAGVIPGGLGGLNPIFSAKLPTGGDGSIPGGVGVASNFAPRPMTEEDWLTYGQRPEKSFFNYVPQPPTGMAHGGSLAAKRGGRPSRSSFAVNGPGTGRSDDIPAVLSDGEYVMDAETVALLGDGSSKAGAQKLDDLRVKIRKHKGQRLSQGRFSSDAKKPEAYLSGGRI